MTNITENLLEDDDKTPLTLFEVACSVFAAAFGVQSEVNKKRDFRRGKPMQFIIVGVTFTFALMFSLAAIISVVSP